MAFLEMRDAASAGAYTEIPVAAAELEYEEIGDRARAFDGTALSTIRGWKRAWRITTILDTPTDIGTIETLLQSAQRFTAQGELVGGAAVTLTTQVELVGQSVILDGTTTTARALIFRLLEE